MSRVYSQFCSLTSLLAGTVTVAGIVTFAPAPLLAKSPQEIGQIAITVTVQINGKYSNSNRVSSGSGFIIAKQGNTYTALTCNHVVDNSQATYTIRTHTGKDYPVTRAVLLQKETNQPDLAVVTFDSPESYPVVTFGDSEQAVIGADIFVSGYPANSFLGKSGTNRNHEFSRGAVTSRLPNHPRGYTLRYYAITKGGMSGGPVFDGEGRVVGIHGQGDLDYEQGEDPQENPTGIALTKTGFNAAIPVNTFLAKLSEAGLNRSAILVNTSPPSNAPAGVNSPRDAKTYYVRGLSRFDTGDLSGAIADLTQALQTQPDYAEAYFYRGLAYFEQKVLPKSMADYSKVIELNAAYVDAYYNRGLVLSAMGDKPGAVSDYTQVIRLDRSFAAAYNNRGVALSELGDQKQAIDDFNQALQINPGRANTYFNRGLALFRTGNDRAALADYTQAIQLSPNYAKAYANRGITLTRMGDRQGAIADLEQAARLFNAQGMTSDAQKALDMIRQLQR
ncbi:tetratricopeptide repeat-containing S1 family peptidase [Kamptonema formosum]|uniref:tetratricopeptide repeat-containing S1 family peptidase n=1 Tax=Kamptonema formosum TaxID=331992 RepID=UPI00035D4C9A|nr:tetratricopeptide repeat-containing serine protease family protein [Oscillatoria sp. PCC 10802]